MKGLEVIDICKKLEFSILKNLERILKNLFKGGDPWFTPLRDLTLNCFQHD